MLFRSGGDAIYEDVNHDGQIDELDIVYLGSSLPKITGGFGFKLHYGRLTLNSQFNFRYGNKIINRAGKFSIDFNVTFANNRNKLTEMDETVLASLNSDFKRQNGSYLSRVELNRPLGGIYGFRYKGVFQYSKYSEVEVPGVSGPNAPVARDAEGNVILDNYGRTKPIMFC